MRLESILVTSLLVVLFCLPTMRFNQIEVKAPNGYPVHNLNTGLNYTTIQEAIDVNETLDGHTVLADVGTYHEHVVIHKSIRLIGQNSTNTIIDGNGTGTVVQAGARNSTVSGFTIQHGFVGLSIWNTSSRIVGNSVKDNEMGMYISWDNNTITDNILAGNVFGMYLTSNGNELRNNEINENNYNFIGSYVPIPIGSAPYNNVDLTNTINGRSIYYLVNKSNLDLSLFTFPKVGYLGLINCFNITVRNLTLTDNGEGILVWQSDNCTIQGNTIEDNLAAVIALTNNTFFSENSISRNYHGITLTGNNNKIAHNIIANNTLRLSPYRWPEVPPKPPTPIQNWVHWGVMSWVGGILPWHLDNSTIIDNEIANNEHGILLSRSSFNILRKNKFAGNVHNFGMEPVLFPSEWIINPPEIPQISPYLMNDVDMSNCVDGKPIYWGINRHHEQVPVDAGYVLLVNSTNVIVKDLTLRNNTQGILLVDVNDTTVSNNVITDNRYGILTRSTLTLSLNNTIVHNNLERNGVGIESRATNSMFSYNVLTHNLVGIHDRTGYNAISGNNITHNALPPKDEWILGYEPTQTVPIIYIHREGLGIVLEGSNSTVSCNLIQNNGIGINAEGKNNEICHNNFINNTWQAEIYSVNKWDSGYPSGGNYWSDHDVTDWYSGIHQNELGSDGIGDISYWLAKYVIDPSEPPEVRDQYDKYPLMGMFSDFNATSEYHIQTICNSSISDFQFNGTAIMFNLTGVDGTAGFCRICIPTDLMNVTYRVFINGTEVSCNLLPFSNSTHSYLYFNYTDSTQEVIIMPEFPSFLILLLFMVTTLLTVIVCRRKHTIWFF